MKNTIFSKIKKDLKLNKSLYILVLPVLIFYIIFHYKPMYGAVIALGFAQFIRFFNSPYFVRILRNTVLLSVYGIIFGFPAPIILALLLNELKQKKFKKTVQTATYLTHFISLVVVTGIIKEFTQSTGLINDIIELFGGTRTSLIQNPALYRTIYITSDIWQEIGWGSIIYLAALSGIDEQLYEAASIDGANRWNKLLHVTLPGISTTIIIMLILRLGQILGSSYEKTILLYNEATYETADVIASYIYRVGILERNWSYSTAIGLFNSGINFIFLLVANKLSKKVSETSLW